MKRKRCMLTLLLCILYGLCLCGCGAISTKDAAAYNDNQDKNQVVTVPAGRPEPIDAENQIVDHEEEGTCTLFVECSTILSNINSLDKTKRDLVPEDGVIFAKQEVSFFEGETVFDVLKREMRENDIQMEFTWTPGYSSNYVEGIANLYEFDCGELSGWMFCVNDWCPNYGASRYIVGEGDVIEWHYTCDLGADLGQEME